MVERDNELKGTTFTISVLHLSDGNPARIRQLLEAKVAQAPQFFNCAPLVLNVERLEAIPISNSSGSWSSRKTSCWSGSRGRGTRR